MSPPRTARSADAAPCHQKGWLSVVSRSRVCGKKERRRCGGRKGTGSSGAGTLLSVPDDMLGAIFASGSLTLADVVRCAATCKECARVVASRSEYISRGLPPLGRYLSSLAVGFFTASITRMRKPHFIPTAAGARLLGDCQISLLDGFQLATLKLRWFCEKSGLILFTLEESSGYPGTFALDVQSSAVKNVVNGPTVSWRNIHLESPAVVKVADGHSWSCFVGYEMDIAIYLAALTT
ncbi:hypothetical protein ABZP36_012560 [Zizania latifolia]